MEGDTVSLLRAVTYPDLKIPQYHWESSDSEIIRIEPDPNDASAAYLIAVGDSGQKATITVLDVANDLDKQFDVGVGFYQP